MAITRIGDVIQPEIFTNYVDQQTTIKSELIKSGIVVNDPQFDALASGANTLVNMPYFNDLSGESEVMTDSGALTPDKIGTGKDVAVKQGRARAWGANGLSALLSGADPMQAIGSLVADYWVRDQQKILLSTLNGVFASASMADHILDTSALTGGAELLDDASFVDSTQLLGDAKDIVTGVMMHSAVESYLVKQKLVEYVEVGQNEYGVPIKVPFYMGKRVIVDDAMAYNSGTKVAEMFIFGSGAIALGNGSHPNIIGTEVDRDSLASSGEDFLINRRIFILHPRGIKWTDAANAGVFPTNAELATGTNWDRVYDSKKIRIVKHKFKIS